MLILINAGCSSTPAKASNGISRERVRQIEKEALSKLRRSDLVELSTAA